MSFSPLPSLSGLTNRDFKKKKNKQKQNNGSYNQVFKTLGGSPNHASHVAGLFRLMMSQGVKRNSDTASAILWNNTSLEAVDVLLTEMSSWNVPLNQVRLQLSIFCLIVKNDHDLTLNG